MRTNAEIINNVLLKAQKMRQTRRIRTAITSVALSGIFVFLVAFSNIIPVSANFYANSYKKYLAPYATTQSSVKLTASETVGDDIPEAALRFIDENNAVVSLDGVAYPCLIQAKSKTSFTLTSVAEEEEDLSKEEKPSAFRVEFWEDSANLSWKIGGIEFKKVLSVAEERELPTGLWTTYALQSGNSPAAPTSNGLGWTLILENGKSYAGEGRDAYLSQFLSVNNILLQCFFDTKSGLILDASVCTYDTTTFEFPTLKERYLSDGDEHYTYSRLLADSEKLQFSGGSFNAVGVTYSADDYRVSKKDLIHESVADMVAQWRLFPKSSCDTKVLDTNAKLDLQANGNALLTVTGDMEFKGKTKGKWYPLKDSILVVLNENAKLTGRIFTVYAKNAKNEKNPTADELEKYAMTTLYAYDFYKVGYHVFEYHAVEEETQIFLGNAWEKDFLIPKLVYEQTYVLNGKYLPSYYDRAPEAPTTLTPMMDNGKITLVFHEDKTVTVTYLDTGSTQTLTFSEKYERHIEFSQKIYCSFNKDLTGRLDCLNIQAGYLDYEFVYWTNDGEYTFLIYTFELIPQA